MGKPKRKQIMLLVTVTVPDRALPGDVRADIRNLLSGGAISGLLGNAKLKSVKPAGKIVAAAQRAFDAWGGGPKPRPSRERLPVIDYIDNGGS